jgi:hypothetical protein
MWSHSLAGPARPPSAHTSAQSRRRDANRGDVCASAYSSGHARSDLTPACRRTATVVHCMHDFVSVSPVHAHVSRRSHTHALSRIITHARTHTFASVVFCAFGRTRFRHHHHLSHSSASVSRHDPHTHTHTHTHAHIHTSMCMHVSMHTDVRMVRSRVARICRCMMSCHMCARSYAHCAALPMQAAPLQPLSLL